MPKSSRSRNVLVHDDDDDDEDDQVEAKEEFDDDDEEEEEEEEQPSPAKKSRRSKIVLEEDDDEEEEEARKDNVPLTANSLALCSQVPETTQDIAPARDAERNKFIGLSEDRREKAIADVLRLVLFKAFSGDPIDRLKIAKDAQINEAKITGAVFEEVNLRLENLFCMKLRRVPAFLEKMKDFPPRCKDRYYVVNTATDPSGNHTRSLHMVHKASSMEKGLLMAVLGFIFCKGDARSDGSRWLLDKELYRLLHVMDENLPPEPPVQGGSSRGAAAAHKLQDGPDVDAALDRFVKMDYLFRLKANEQFMAMNDQAEETSNFYAMGTRAAVEIGRLQVVHFIGQTLEEEISQEILDEITNEDEEE